MANTPDPLTQLRDIHLPDFIGWWPLAFGWYLVSVLIVLFIASLVYFLYQKNRNAIAKNKALSLLKTYKEHYEKEQDAQWASARVSELLKRVALVYYPRTQVASMCGEDWIVFLNQSSKGLDFQAVKALLLELPFKSAESVDLEPLFSTAAAWIRQRGVPCLN